MTQHERDMSELMGLESFRRFLFRSIQSAGLLSQASNGADSRDLAFAEGRRSLMFDILRDADAGQPDALRHPLSILTLIAALREEVNTSPAKEKKRDDRYDAISD